MFSTSQRNPERIRGTLSSFAEDTELSGAVGIPEGQDAIHGDLEKQEKWPMGIP